MDRDKTIGVAMAIGFIGLLLLLAAIYFALSPTAPGRHADAGCVSGRCFASQVGDQVVRSLLHARQLVGDHASLTGAERAGA